MPEFQQMLLFPEQADWQPENSEQLVSLLDELGFVSSPIAGLEGAWLLGDGFLQQVSFMGCSPAVELLPSDLFSPQIEQQWKSFTFIYIPSATDTVSCYMDIQRGKPRCHSCGKRVVDWQAKIDEDTLTASTVLDCPFCKTSAGLSQWDWVQDGGCARQFIHVVNIYPQEAVPTDGFMNALAKSTGTAWKVAYCSSEINAINKLLDSH